MTEEQKCLEWLKHRRDNMPMAGAKRMFGIAISALEKQEQDRWVPVTERLPELDTDVLVTDQYGNVWQAAYVEWCGIERFVSAEESITLEDVIAWKPLPEAYKAEDTEWTSTN
jgi:hypothetical protein